MSGATIDHPLVAPTSNPVVLIRLAWNPRGWTAGVRHDRAEGGWPELHSWAGEDWNFAVDQAVGGIVYGFSQAVPGQEAVANNKNGLWDIVFFTRDPAGHSGVVGLYRNATVLRPETPARAAAWETLAKIAEVRARQLKVAFGGETALGKSKYNQYMKEKAVSWSVTADDIVTVGGFPGLPTPFDDWRRFHRFQNAYTVPGSLDEFLAGLVQSDDSELAAAGFSAPTGTPTAVREGQQRQRMHLVRERSSALARQYRASRLRLTPKPHYECEACGTTLLAEHADFAVHGFDAHHQLPLHGAGPAGTATKAEDLCMLCVRCHRLAHSCGVFSARALGAVLATLNSSGAS